MLSCEDVRAELPGIEAGERADGAVRDHLASCEECREAGKAIRGDVETLRDGLSALAPSPLAEDAVLDIARDPEVAAPRRAGSWKPVILTVAAASLLFAVVLFNQRGGSPGGEGGGEGGPLVAMPPTAGMVDGARGPEGDVAPYTSGPGLRHWYRDKSYGVTTYANDTMDPPADGVHHRWVFKPGEQGHRHFQLVGVPPRGVQVLGKELLDRVEGGAKGLALQEFMGSQSQAGTLIISSPVPGGPTARVDVILRPDYSGSVLLEEPLGRALGLYHFEIPGGGRVMGDTRVHVHRARARVRLEPKGLDTKTKEIIDLPVFDEIVEVQVRHIGDPYPATVEPVAKGQPRLEVRGAAPDAIDLHARPWTMDGAKSDELSGDGPPPPMTTLAPLRDGPSYFRLPYARRTRPSCTVFLPPLDVGGGHPRSYGFRMTRMEIRGTFEPGAEVVVARVWQGGTAIPSRESVAVTTVADDGTISFPRLVGEDGKGLRVRIRDADGRVRWVDVKWGGNTIVMNLTADGNLAFKGYVFSLQDADGTLVGPKVVAAIVNQLREYVERVGQRDARGVSDVEVLINAQSSVPWTFVQWVMQMCAHPTVRVYKLRFKISNRDDAPLLNNLPFDKGLMTAEERSRTPVLQFRLFHDGGRTTIRQPETGRELVLGAGNDQEALAAVRALAEDARTKLAMPFEVHLVTPPPKGGQVPYEHIWLVTRSLQDAGVRNVLFEGAAMPR